MIFVRVKIKVTRDFFVIPLTRRSYVQGTQLLNGAKNTPKRSTM
jgi:hypothetical protein